MTDLTKYTLDEALKGMKRGDFTSVELTQAHINACENATELNAFVTTSFEQALEEAKNSDLRRAKGEIGIIEGAPLGVKDLFCTDGVKTTAGSNILDQFEPTYESSVTANMNSQGIQILSNQYRADSQKGLAAKMAVQYKKILSFKKRIEEEEAEI